MTARACILEDFDPRRSVFPGNANAPGNASSGAELDELAFRARSAMGHHPLAEVRSLVAATIRSWRASEPGTQLRRADALSLPGLLHSMYGDKEAALRSARTIRDWGAVHGNDAARIAGTYRLGATLQILGDPDGAIRSMEMCRSILSSHSKVGGMVAMTCLVEAAAWRQKGELGIALNRVQLCAREARKSEEPLLHAASQLNMGSIFRYRGELHSALECFQSAAATAEFYGDTIRTHLGLLGIFAVQTQMGVSPDESRLIEVEERLGRDAPHRHLALRHEYLAEALANEGSARALPEFRTALRHARLSRSTTLVSEIHVRIAEFSLSLDRRRHARWHLARAEAAGLECGEMADRLCAERLRIRLDDSLGADDRRERLAEHGLRARRKGFYFEYVVTLRDAMDHLTVHDAEWHLLRDRFDVLAREMGASGLLRRCRPAGPAPALDLGSHGIVTCSRIVLDQTGHLELIAPTDIPVLIRGESGTGKELIAQLVHRLSDRSDGPFEAINCAAIPGELMESQLFGHRRGAFTGASEDKPGLFTLASGGTLFLDEIGEMSPALQAKLLRVLESGEIRPVGSPKREFVDVRIVAATNVDMQKAIADGGFRKDLYYRLAGMEFHLPPLRDRREDILPLAQEFIRQINDTETAPRLSREAVTWLLGRPWEGNVRELKLTIRRALAVCRGGEILPEHLGGDSSFRPAQGLLQEMEAIERVRIRSALEASDFSMTQAAKILGVSRTTLYGKIERLGIELPRKQ